MLLGPPYIRCFFGDLQFIIHIPQILASLGSTFSPHLLRSWPGLPIRPSVQITWRIPHLPAFIHPPSIPGRASSSAIHSTGISSMNSGRFLCVLTEKRSRQAAGRLKVPTQAGSCPMHQQEIRCRLVRHRPHTAADSMYTARLWSKDAAH